MTRTAAAVMVAMLGAGGALWTAAAAGGKTAVLLSPLDGNPPLTSTFGEYRRGHYHGGLDYSTGGQEGIPVITPGPGWVWRIRCSGIGYGRAVYFRLEDGRTVLYAHLSRFHSELEAEAERVQDREGRYEIDYRPPRGAIRLSAGDTLGFTGQSGAGPPHLHAEMRVGEEAVVAVNPLQNGWSTDDPVPPRITRLRVEPAAAGVLLGGGLEPFVLDFDEKPHVPRVEISGPVRLWLEADDSARNGAYRLAPLAAGWSLDGRPMTQVVFDRFDWHWAREAEWTFHSARARMENERWICLTPPIGSRQQIARGAQNPWRGLEPGTHRLRFWARDANGNRDEREVVVELQETPRETLDVAWEGHLSRLWSRGSYLEWRLPARHPSDLPHSTAPDGSSARPGWQSLPAVKGWVGLLGEPDPAWSGLWRFRLHEEAVSSAVEAVWVSGAETRPVHVEAAGIRIEVPPGVTYGPLWISIEEGDPIPPGEEEPDLEPMGHVVHLGPWATPLRGRIRVELPEPGGSRRGLAVYELDHQGKLEFLGADTSGTGVAASLSSLESIALLHDDTPPRIDILPPPPTRRPALQARVEDGGAGLNWQGLSMTANGRRLIAEWDPEANLLTAHLRNDLPPGTVELQVDAVDRTGNRSRKTLSFRVP